MQKSEQTIRELLDLAEVEVRGSNPWDIQVYDQRFYDRLIRDTTLGLGESYMDGWWDCDALDQFVTRVLKKDLDRKIRQSTVTHSKC
jgi:cyclopropane-fatty-acyl-phospholipid synthase